MKKRAKVHLLPTDKTDGTLWKTISEQLIHIHVSGEYKEKYQPFNLYITTDDEIKEGDWYYWPVTNTIQCFKSFNGDKPTKDCKKIIATTDPKLHSTRLKDCPINPEDNMVSVRGVSKPSKEFIEEYCKAGGIDEVDVEYEKHLKSACTCEDIDCPNSYFNGNDYSCSKRFENGEYWKEWCDPKITSNNEIIIHPVKDSWTVEDLPDLLNRFCKDHSLHRELQITDDMIREWLEKQ